MLSTNAISQERKCSAVVREEKFNVGMAKEHSRANHRRNGSTGVERILLNDYGCVSTCSGDEACMSRSAHMDQMEVQEASLCLQDAQTQLSLVETTLPTPAQKLDHQGISRLSMHQYNETEQSSPGIPIAVVTPQPSGACESAEAFRMKARVSSTCGKGRIAKHPWIEFYQLRPGN